ncbi:unnamed protein product [Adineta steineri]|uniref:Uncharacterized protein n=1 Tax=Adineta steineri TaxID=433720 RepID=A0A814TRS0_9BILA|nr:unnamed protein product [Adineta steineri]CAF3963477.1 unnamed protein product [Adineta steineri]
MNVYYTIIFLGLILVFLNPAVSYSLYHHQHKYPIGKRFKFQQPNNINDNLQTKVFDLDDEDHNIELISNLSHLLSLVSDQNNEKILQTFLKQTSTTNLYKPPLSIDNDIDNMNFLIEKILQNIKIFS